MNKLSEDEKTVRINITMPESMRDEITEAFGRNVSAWARKVFVAALRRRGKSTRK